MPRKKSRVVSADDTYSKEARTKIAAYWASSANADGGASEYAAGKTDTIDSLVGRLFFSECRTLRITTSLDGQIWTKCCIREGAFPRHYLLVSHPPGTPLSVCLTAICEKILSFEEGALRPSPDTYEG